MCLYNKTFTWHVDRATIQHIWIFSIEWSQRRIGNSTNSLEAQMNCLLVKATLSRASHLHEEHSFNCCCYNIFSSLKKLMNHKATTIPFVEFSYENDETSLLNRCAISCMNILVLWTTIILSTTNYHEDRENVEVRPLLGGKTNVIVVNLFIINNKHGLMWVSHN